MITLPVDPLRMAPPRTAPPHIVWLASGRYASYCNAFLLLFSPSIFSFFLFLHRLRFPRTVGDVITKTVTGIVDGHLL